jgi:hypothetical protein
MNFNIIHKDATISLIPLIFVSAMKMKYNWARVLSLNLLLYRFLASLISLRIRLQKSEYVMISCLALSYSSILYGENSKSRISESRAGLGRYYVTTKRK